MSKLQRKDVMAASIMQEHGQSVRGIARALGVDESSLRDRLKRFREGIEDGRKRQPEACTPWHEVIMTWVEENILKRDRPYPVKALHELLVCEHGFTGTYKSVLRYVRRRTPKPKKRPCRRFESRPGTQGQVDWFHVPVWIGELGGVVMLYAFVMVLSFSRKWAVVWSRSQDMLSWINCHNKAFDRLGGIPVSIRIDNLKTGVASGAGPWAVINEGYKSYADQTGFIVDPARPRKGSDKGKVERRGQDVKRIPLQKGDRFSTIEELQSVTDERVSGLSGEFICPVTGLSIEESWKKEREYLLPLPLSFPEPFDVQVSRKVNRELLVSFEGRQYEVPTRYYDRMVNVRGCAGEVKIFSSDGELLRSYPRHTSCRLLLDRTIDDFEGDNRVISPTPLGKVGQSIVVEKSWEWEASRRAIDEYSEVVESRS
ncbi:MAG: IS21 family transposase [Candidatus Aegiribacteria sp.]|nr:IS21 family transposase [Candidatus Aegiribacteria sp.]